ncbi:LLM class F420-dependent oxidoreductase [Enemella sp. A6]|uniref:LLM class F420-dependent oxidoreductase n=1 Tax=Enemella sp. A6 TaxID=3440152 RepID=UPI003EBE78FB
MKFGLSLGYWGSGKPANHAAMVALAEELGFDSVWTAEAYGSDALTPLAWLGAGTETLKLGTAILQMSARTPVATAMAAMTIDHLSDGRFVLGLGVSGPQVVEGWYGQPFGKPLARTREYIAILRQVFARERVAFSGDFYQLPHEGGTGLGKSLRSTLHPRRPDIPIMLAAEGPKNVALAAELTDGWLPLFYSPYNDQHYRDALAEGFAREGAHSTPEEFEIAATVPVVAVDDVEIAADMVRPFLALYIGGMGAPGANFHYDAFVRMGFAAECEKIQDLYLNGRKDEAAAAVPTSMVEQVALIGPEAKIREEFPAWDDSLLTSMLVMPDEATMRLVADLR